MYIKPQVLLRVKPAYVLRLAHYLGIETLGKLYEDILQEVHLRINWG
jgi:hypothetical protein